MPASHICAGWQTNWQTSCQGDSGGPLVKATSTRDVLVGIVSYGPNLPCGQQLTADAFTSIMAMRPWIDAARKKYKV